MQALRPICLIMDEVDGMSSGDRGGVGELSKLVKKTKVCVSFWPRPHGHHELTRPFPRIACCPFDDVSCR